MANASTFTRGFTPGSNRVRGNNTWATKFAFIYFKRAKAKKTVSYSTLGFQEYGMANASNFSRGFTPASNPERGNNTWATKWAFIYVKRAKAKNSVISYLRVPRVRNGQCEAVPLPATPKGVTTYGQRNGLFTLGFPEYGTTYG